MPRFHLITSPTIRFAVLLVLLQISGCCMLPTSQLCGEALTYVRKPLTKNLHNSTNACDNVNGTIIQIREPLSGYNPYTEFNSNAIGEIAKRHVLTSTMQILKN